MEALKVKEKYHYTYADLQAWNTEPGERWELIDGEAYMMATPSTKHQAILMELGTQFHTFLRGKPCRVYASPLEVRLFPKADGSDDTYVEPDMFIVCDQSKIDERGCKGAPDLIVEVLSPSTRSIDLVAKFNKYLQARVREYWVIDPDAQTLQIFSLDNDRYITRSYDAEAKTVEVGILPGCVIDLAALFPPEEKPKGVEPPYRNAQ